MSLEEIISLLEECEFGYTPHSERTMCNGCFTVLEDDKPFEGHESDCKFEAALDALRKMREQAKTPKGKLEQWTTHNS